MKGNVTTTAVIEATHLNINKDEYFAMRRRLEMLESENAALRKWSKAWKRTAKLHRGFYQIMAEKAGEWQGKFFKAERELAARDTQSETLLEKIAELKRRNEELEAQLAARERDFRAQDALLEKIAELKWRVERLIEAMKKQ